MAKKSRKKPKPIEPVEDANRLRSATVQHPRFTITDNSKGVRSGVMEFDLSYDDGKLNTVKVKLSVIACWVDPNNNNCIEAFLIPTEKDCDKSGLGMLKRIIKEFSVIRVTSEHGFVLTGLGECFRYATKDEACPYCSDNELYESTEYFHSRHEAVTKVLGQLEKFNAIGGFESANLNLVTDELLESVGFFKVLDIMAKSPSDAAPAYWGVNTSEMFAAGADDNIRLTYTQKTRQTTKMAVLFADKLRRTIESL